MRCRQAAGDAAATSALKVGTTWAKTETPRGRPARAAAVWVQCEAVSTTDGAMSVPPAGR